MDTGAVITNKSTNQMTGLDQMMAVGLMSMINEETHQANDFHLKFSRGRAEKGVWRATSFTQQRELLVL